MASATTARLARSCRSWWTRMAPLRFVLPHGRGGVTINNGAAAGWYDIVRHSTLQQCRRNRSGRGAGDGRGGGANEVARGVQRRMFHGGFPRAAPSPSPRTPQTQRWPARRAVHVHAGAGKARASWSPGGPRSPRVMAHGATIPWGVCRGQASASLMRDPPHPFDVRVARLTRPTRLRRGGDLGDGGGRWRPAAGAIRGAQPVAARPLPAAAPGACRHGAMVVVWWPSPTKTRGTWSVRLHQRLRPPEA